MGSPKDPITIGILCLVFDETIDAQLVPMLITPSTRVRFVQLKPADLHVFSPPGDLDAVILLHPMNEGRLSLTDVTDARYSKLLPILSSHFGSHGVCVIAYLIQNLKESTELTHLSVVKHNQPSVFEMASCVILCGKLEHLFQRNIQQIHEFMKVNWTNKRKSSWQDEWFRKNPTEGELVDKQTQNPTAEEGEKHGETRFAKDEVVLVTDASGFLGSHIVHRLTEQGYKVRGMLDFEKGTLGKEGANSAIVGMVTKLFPELDLFYKPEVVNFDGLKEVVGGCTHVIHTSRFQDTRSATGDDVTRLLQVCQFDKGIKRVVLTGGSDSLSEDKLRNKEWMKISSALKDAICKDVSEKAAKRFMRCQTEPPKEKTTFGLSIIKPPVVLGPILCELAEANVEIVRRRMENTPSVRFDIYIPVCDVRGVAKAHVNALKCTDAGVECYPVDSHRLSLKHMSTILKNEFKDHGYDFSAWAFSWDSMSQCLRDMHPNQTKEGEQKDPSIYKFVIDMAYSCMERGFIPKKPGYKPKVQVKGHLV